MRSSETIQCPLCSDTVEKLVYRFHLENERWVIALIKEMNPGWSESDGACSRCVDYYHIEVLMKQQVLPGIGPHTSVRSTDDFIILPTPLRLDADARFTGKGITICFIDSGFYPHPDLAAFRDRIKIVVDIAGHNDSTSWGNEHSAWHGTMTSVVCAGDGYLSKGLYKGIACEASLVLLKVMDENRNISNENIVGALQWMLDHHREHDIRIVNISLGSDLQNAHLQYEINRLVQLLADENIVVVAAAGNDEHGMLRAPASSRAAITVGGLDDSNEAGALNDKLYHSTFGTTADKSSKPELIAHAAWIAAPILPGSVEEQESILLHELVSLPEIDFAEKVRSLNEEPFLTGFVIPETDVIDIKNSVRHRLQQSKYVSPHYMHVDGTSFAAPIVSAVIAQLLEIDPTLTPSVIRSILFTTASRIPGVPAERQGFGRINPRKAVLKTLRRLQGPQTLISPVINEYRKTISFSMQHDCASQVSLAGSFNHWAKDVLLLEAGNNGTWNIEIPILPGGRYVYKFFIDGRSWLEDINNPYREPDGFNGFNSILVIGN